VFSLREPLAESRRSPSRREECLDNAQAESRWSRLKTQVVAPENAGVSACERPVFRDAAAA